VTTVSPGGGGGGGGDDEKFTNFTTEVDSTPFSTLITAAANFVRVVN
jgi:hypothetical protein